MQLRITCCFSDRSNEQHHGEPDCDQLEGLVPKAIALHTQSGSITPHFRKQGGRGKKKKAEFF